MLGKRVGIAERARIGERLQRGPRGLDELRRKALRRAHEQREIREQRRERRLARQRLSQRLLRRVRRRCFDSSLIRGLLRLQDHELARVRDAQAQHLPFRKLKERACADGLAADLDSTRPGTDASSTTACSTAPARHGRLRPVVTCVGGALSGLVTVIGSCMALWRRSASSPVSLSARIADS